MCATFGGECQDRLCRTLSSVASCHQFRTGLTDRNKRQAGRLCIWREGQQLHLRGLGWIGQ
jgi:hypothetical protein